MEDRDDRKKQGKSPDVLFAFFSLFPLTLDILIGGDGFAAPATRTPGGFQLSPNDSDSSELFVHGFCNSPHGDMQSDKISPHILQISNGQLSTTPDLPQICRHLRIVLGKWCMILSDCLGDDHSI